MAKKSDDPPTISRIDVLVRDGEPLTPCTHREISLPLSCGMRLGVVERVRAVGRGVDDELVPSRASETTLVPNGIAAADGVALLVGLGHPPGTGSRVDGRTEVEIRVERESGDASMSCGERDGYGGIALKSSDVMV